MHRVALPPDFQAWREAARDALRQGYLPEQIDLQDDSLERPMVLALEADEAPGGPPVERPHVPKAFLEAAQNAAVHRDPNRWNLLYRLLSRLQAERNLLHVGVDTDVAELRRLTDQVRRDVHKMHAFVRFRKVDAPDETGNPTEHYIAWYRPDHRIVPLVAPFFAERFAVMHWTILTPDASVRWTPEQRQLEFGPGVGREQGPREDDVEDLWRSYYASIFNPARLNPEAMRNEMPIRYWGNLPEVDLLPQLLQRAEGRVESMVLQQKGKTTAAPFVPAEHELTILRRAMPSCEGCELYKHATQVVPGVGAEGAHLMLVGEQPGDKEDVEGLPFVGPAGGVLRKALGELRIDPAEVFMTNAVKHFKFVQRGKLRLHQNPRMGEINACRPWLRAELDAVKPRVVLCLGASASKSLLGGTFALMTSRGKVHESPYAERVIATVHPSAVLRARDQAGHEQLYNFLKDDLAMAYELSRHPA